MLLPQLSLAQAESLYVQVGHISPLLVYKQSDLLREPSARSCGMEHGRVPRREPLPQPNVQLNAQASIEGPHLTRRAGKAGCPTTRKRLYMGVAADCSYVSYYGSVEKAFQQILSDWNKASAIYESTFNVALGVIEVQLHDVCDISSAKAWNRQCSQDYRIDRRLDDFSEWRVRNGGPSAGLWHLVSVCVLVSSFKWCISHPHHKDDTLLFWNDTGHGMDRRGLLFNRQGRSASRECRHRHWR